MLRQSRILPSHAHRLAGFHALPPSARGRSVTRIRSGTTTGGDLWRIGSRTAMPAVLELARVAYQEHRWTAAHDAFGDAQREEELTARDLELAATTAFQLGLEIDGLDTL